MLAQRVSPALFALDDRGEIGIRVIDENNIVHFHNVANYQRGSDGVWVTGLPNETNLITVGQEMVVAGERVDPDLQNLSAGALARSLAADARQAGNYNV